MADANTILFPTTLVGSMPQPDWLIDRKKLAGRFPPRVRARELWRVPEEYLVEAQDDATIIAIRAQEEAGLDIVTDGEIRRESYSNLFATALEGVDLDNPGIGAGPQRPPGAGAACRRADPPAPRSRRAGPRIPAPPHGQTVKATVPGPFTMSQQAQIDHYGGSRRPAAADYAAALNAEIRDLFSAGADIVQIDEPYMQARPDEARQFGLEALNRALEGVKGTTAVHICFGYAAIIHSRSTAYSFLPELAGCHCQQISLETAQPNLDCSILATLNGKKIMLGVLDLGSTEVETPETVAARIRRALPFVRADNLVVAPDCGLKYLSRDVAFGKLKAMVAGAAILRAELARTPGPVRMQLNS